MLLAVLVCGPAHTDGQLNATSSVTHVPLVEAGNHAGYYYPPLTSREVYTPRTSTLAGSDRRRRIAFVTGFMAQMMDRSFAPDYVMFTKGDEADKLIITATRDDTWNTLYRMRGLLAVLTAQARGSELFRSAGVDDIFTFLDLLKLIGFRQLTVTDGDGFAHQFRIE